MASFYSFTAHANDREYSDISKKSIRYGTVAGALSGFIDAAFFAYLHGARDLKDVKRYFTLLAAGAGLGGFIGYGLAVVMTPEWDFELLKNEFKTIAESRYIALLAETPNDNFINELNTVVAAEMLSVYAAFKIYSKYLKRIESSKTKLQNILKSESTQLYEPALELLKEFDSLESKILSALIAIKKDELFLKEFAYASYIEALNQQTVMYVYYY